MFITSLVQKFIHPKEYIEGLSLYKNKDWEKALNLFERAIELKNNQAQSHFKAGMCNLKLGKFEDAYAYIDQAIKLAPTRSEWKIQLEQCSRHLDKLRTHMMSTSAAEEDLLRDKINQDLNNPKLYDKLAVVLHKKGRWWQEIDALKNAIELDASNQERYFRIGVALEKMGQYGEASKYYGKGLSLKSKNDAIWYYSLGYALEKSLENVPHTNAHEKQYDLAIAMDKKLDSKEYGIGAFHQHKGRWLEAISSYEKYIFSNPMNAELYYRLGLAYDRCYNWEKAEENYKKALSLDVSKPHWHYRLGFVLERQNKFSEAAVSYQYAAQNNSKHVIAWFYRAGITYSRAGIYKKACEMFLSAYEQLLQKIPLLKHPSNSNDLYIDAYRSKLKYEQKINTLKSAIINKFDNSELWFELGKTFGSSGNWEEAALAYEESILRDNNHTQSRYLNLGYSLFKCARYQQACVCFEKIESWTKPYGVPNEILTKNSTFRKNSIYTEYYETREIEKGTILYESFHGASITCNPYALFLYLIDEKKFNTYRHYWVINDENKIPESMKGRNNVFFVKRQSDLYMQCLASCEYLINNVSFPEYFIRKAEQKYLNTWHGTPIKYLGKDIKDEFLAHKNVARNFLQASHLLSPNSYTTDILLKRYDVSNLFCGDIKELGYPRIDRTINISPERIKIIRERLNISSLKKVVLYAPTWRGAHGDATLDIEKLKNDLILLSKQNCYIIFRGHHMTEKSLSEQMPMEITVVPHDIDTNELLGVTDILITDYSSIAFDYLVMNKPIIYYAYDLDKYEQERGLYFSLEELPGTVCLNECDLIKDLNDYLNNTKVFDSLKGIEKYCSHDDGKVSEKVASWFFDDVIIQKTYNNTKENIVFYIGPFMPNGILTSWLNLSVKINRDKYNISLVVDPKAINSFEERFMQFKRIAPDIQVIGTCGSMLYSTEEKWLNDKLNSQFSLASSEMYDVLNHAYRREYLRIFGFNHVDHLIHFEGYNLPWILLFANSPDGLVNNKVVFQHNDKMSEWKERFPYLGVVFSYYNKFNKLVSVSEQTMLLNRNNLSHLFNIEHDNFTYCDNIQNPQEVLAKSLEIDESGFCFNQEHKYFITLGRLSIEKDQQKLINAFHRLYQLNPKIELLILGDGPLKNDLLRQINKLKLEHAVHLLGRISNPFPLLKQADCFVLSSNHEGQPMVLFEAMILNKPIISTDIVGSRSALEGRSGILVDNSVEGLYIAMKDFIDGKLEFEYYDINLYQKNAIQMFYEKCLC